jgi:hypothetical protein
MDANIVKQLYRTIGMAAIVGILPCLLFETAAAQTTMNSPARLGTFSKLPDWSGIWRVKGSPALLDVEDGKSFVPGVRDHPPYTPEWEAKYQVDLVRAEHQGDVNYPNQLVDTHTVFCAAGMPHIISMPLDYEFIVTPEITWIIMDSETRHIYTDGRSFPPEDELWPTLLGRSIGHWEQTREGQTLVVETISVRTGIWADLTPAMLSGQEKFLERIRQIDANTLEDQVAITDPVALTKPWTFTKHYTRMKPGTWAAEPNTCGGPDDRNPIVNGQLTTVMPRAK